MGFTSSIDGDIVSFTESAERLDVVGMVMGPIRKHICCTRKIPFTMIASSETCRFKELLLKSSKNFNGSACLSRLASIAFVMTNGLSVLASIAVVSQIPTERKIYSICLLVLASIAVGRPNPTERKYISRSKHCLCVPKLSVSLSKHWIWASKSVYQSQQALLLS